METILPDLPEVLVDEIQKIACIKKSNEKINDIVPVKITDAKGVTLFGNCLTKKELLYEAN